MFQKFSASTDSKIQPKTVESNWKTMFFQWKSSNIDPKMRPARKHSKNFEKPLKNIGLSLTVNWKTKKIGAPNAEIRNSRPSQLPDPIKNNKKLLEKHEAFLYSV